MRRRYYNTDSVEVEVPGPLPYKPDPDLMNKCLQKALDSSLDEVYKLRNQVCMFRMILASIGYDDVIKGVHPELWE